MTKQTTPAKDTTKIVGLATTVKYEQSLAALFTEFSKEVAKKG